MNKSYFAGLDFLRGIATICVLLLHWFEGNGYTAFGSSLLAVDLFFLISGFVIACSYEERLLAGYRFSRFMLQRVIRLYPILILGIFLCFFRFALKSLVENGYIEDILYCDLLLNLFMIPKTFPPEGPMFELNIALWSLFYEFIAYMIFGFALFRARTAGVLMILLVAAIPFSQWVRGAFAYSVEGGFIYGMARALMFFSMGLVLYRILPALEKLRVSPVFFFIPALIFALPRDFMPWWLFFIVAIVVFPVSIVSAMQIGMTGKVAMLSKFTGDISYPLYVIHTPLMWIMGGMLKSTKTVLHLDKVWNGVVILPVIILMSYAIFRLYDLPARAWFQRRIFVRKESTETVS